MKPYSNQDYHDEITRFFDTYYAVKKASENGDSIPVKDRITNADELIEQYVEQHGQRPPNAILSRLATYILLDTLTDSHPDKMAREEYPIMSYGQTGRHFARNGKLADKPFEHEAVIGYSPGLDSDGKYVRNPILSADNAEQRASDWRLFIREILSEREAFIIERTYEDGATQAEIAEELSVSRQRVGVILSEVYEKLGEIISE